jgi:hypothetical protein
MPRIIGCNPHVFDLDTKVPERDCMPGFVMAVGIVVNNGAFVHFSLLKSSAPDQVALVHRARKDEIFESAGSIIDENPADGKNTSEVLKPPSADTQVFARQRLVGFRARDGLKTCEDDLSAIAGQMAVEGY